MEKLKGLKIEEDEIMISFDIEALFPSVPREYAYKLLVEWIDSQNISNQEAELCARLVKLVLDQRWLQFWGEIFSLVDGLFIGNSLSSILTEAWRSKWGKKVGFQEHGCGMSSIFLQL